MTGRRFPRMSPTFSLAHTVLVRDPIIDFPEHERKYTGFEFSENVRGEVNTGVAYEARSPNPEEKLKSRTKAKGDCRDGFT